MTTPKPPHPSAIPRIPMRHTATIKTHHGWWFRYTVHRLHSIGIPENDTSLHRTRRGAQRAAQRWISRDKRTPVDVPLHDQPNPQPSGEPMYTYDATTRQILKNNQPIAHLDDNVQTEEGSLLAGTANGYSIDEALLDQLAATITQRNIQTNG